MTSDHLGEFFVGFEPLPLEARAPVLEETPRAAFAFVAQVKLASQLTEKTMNSELFDTGIFPFATGQTPVWPTVEELAQLDTMIAAEDALERALDQAEQTYVRCDDAAPMLASILGMWCHLKQARTAV
jgi:hypothetical protein